MAELKFNSDGRFSVMLLGDPHQHGETETQRDRDIAEDTSALINAALDKLKPDLGIYMGDNALSNTPEMFRKALEVLLKPFEDRGIPVALVFGNHDHDNESSVPLADQVKYYREYSQCLFAEEPAESGYWDYNLTVKSSDGTRDAFNFWLMDSGNHAPPEYNSNYAFVTTPQLDWYTEKCKELAEKNGTPVPAINIQHIPVPEEALFLKKVSPLMKFGYGIEGLNAHKGGWYLLDRKNTDVIGEIGEFPCCCDYNNGQFARWKENGDVIAAFFGHDHLNDQLGTLDGIALGQCRLAGFRPYGDGMRQAVRMIYLDENEPRRLRTSMHFYRELVGNSCKSIPWKLKVVSDKQSMALNRWKYVAGALAGAAVIAAGASGIYKYAKK
ncbi:MAG: hypothetical protein GX851_02965 [Clostridiales bacterium]|nr:hypothetical protein [Clostridiales bacterium]